ncbi:phosphotransferase family protein [Nonomuraea wenchangensis]|uniref:phosphotransferase family protein n=1 Tax=Nonomuraea wenchangensis TaxID=568860 RepID=UPI00384B05CE
MSGVPVEAVAAAYGLGEPVGPAVYAARGELGRIWRLDTRRGSWAVKEALAAAAVDDGGGWREALRESVGELIALDELIVPPDPAAVVTCHRDITPENVRRAADGGIVVLDWENCGPASPAWELAKVLADLPEGAAGPAYRAYRDAGGPGRVTAAADFSMAVAEQGHLLEFYARRAMNPEESEENRTRAGARLRAMLARPLTRARIERLLKECARVSVRAG